jgi:hypothetical protein
LLAILIERAKSGGQIKGVIPHLVDGGLSILQYADNTIIFMEHDLEKARNLKIILAAFEQLSGLKINFHKSELFYFGKAQNDTPLYAELFGCGQGQFPSRYLGILIHYRRLTIAEWKVVEERLQKRLLAVLAAQLGTPRGRCDENSSRFPSIMKPRFNRPVGERNHF